MVELVSGITAGGLTIDLKSPVASRYRKVMLNTALELNLESLICDYDIYSCTDKRARSRMYSTYLFAISASTALLVFKALLWSPDKIVGTILFFSR